LDVDTYKKSFCWSKGELFARWAFLRSAFFSLGPFCGTKPSAPQAEYCNDLLSPTQANPGE
jgi:hypothetical protein